MLLKGQLEQGTDSFVSVTPQAGRGRVDSGPEYAITETPAPLNLDFDLGIHYV